MMINDDSPITDTALSSFFSMLWGRDMKESMVLYDTSTTREFVTLGWLEIVEPSLEFHLNLRITDLGRSVIVFANL